MKIFWIRGDKLFNRQLEKGFFTDYDHVFLLESKEFTSRFRYHIQKIQFLFSAMRACYKNIIQNNPNQDSKFEYFDISQDLTLEKVLKNYQSKSKADSVTLTVFEGSGGDISLNKLCKKLDINLEILDSPDFITSKKLSEKHFQQKDNYYFESFYRDQRKELGILVNKEDEPTGGKWNYDHKNRKKIPKDLDIPKIKIRSSDNEIANQVSKDISKYFSEKDLQAEPYNDEVPTWVPFTHKHAAEWLSIFIKDRLEFFGDYEDAITDRDPFLFHSVLSPMINIGLLEPRDIIDKLISAYEDGRRDISINQVEGIVRQIIGWREYVREIYLLEGDNQVRSNFFKHSNKLTDHFYTASTKIEPLDDVINKVNGYGYAHHIERLMIIGNFMLICEIDPKEVYQWFMELFVDAYDWVMVPNIMGMSQFADGGKMMTKPYFSSSNYIFKMSDYSRKDLKEIEFENITTDWAEIWDSLYWEFMNKHSDFLVKNARMGFLVNVYNKKTKEQKTRYKSIKKAYYEYLFD